MKLEDQVVSLDLAKRLKELGVKQQGYFCWAQDVAPSRASFRTKDDAPHYPAKDSKPYVTSNYGALSTYTKRICTTPTVGELGGLLPADKLRLIHKSPVGDCWTLPIRADNHPSDRGTDHVDTEADARAKMLIYLIENNLLTPTQDLERL